MLFKNKETIDEDDIKVINQIRGLSIDIIHEAQGGHSGIALGAAPILYTLYSRHLKVNPNDSNWINRDRFVMSAGHGSSLLYATLFLCGYPIEVDDLKSFRKIDSIMPGHPTYLKTPGVDATTGALGQGVGIAVGMAIGEDYLRKTLKDENEAPIDYYTYCFVSDGDLMEGVSYEALSLAGTLKLNKLIILYDNNSNTMDSDTSVTFTEDVIKRMDSFGFETIVVEDGEDINAIDRAIDKAKASDKPTFISIRTTIGKYSKFEGTNQAHNGNLDVDDISKIKELLGLRDIPFAISNETREYFMRQVIDRNIPLYEKFQKEIDEYLEKPLLNRIQNNDFKISLNNLNINLDDIGDNVSLRDISGDILTSVDNPLFVGGSCDLFSSCKTYQKDKGDFSPKNRSGRNLWFGVREHASGAIINGLLLSGIRSYTSTFLAFSNYMMPAIRMSAIMNLPAIYIFTHDSVRVGEDGTTHQAIYEIDSLRLIPNVEVFRPADVNELIGTYKTVLSKNEGVSIIILPRDSVQTLTCTSVKDTSNGAYIVSESELKIDNILISSGEDLDIALEVQKRLLARGIGVRVVSMPSTNRFDSMSDEYKKEILPDGISKYVIEASTANTLLKYVDDYQHLINISTFGLSGSRDDVIKKLNFDIDSILEKWL